MRAADPSTGSNRDASDKIMVPCEDDSGQGKLTVVDITEPAGGTVPLLDEAIIVVVAGSRAAGSVENGAPTVSCDELHQAMRPGDRLLGSRRRFNLRVVRRSYLRLRRALAAGVADDTRDLGRATVIESMLEEGLDRAVDR